MKRFKSFAALLLALLLTVPAFSFSACSETPKKEEESAAPASNEPAQTADEAANEEADDGKSHYFESFDAVDYDGWKLNIANDGLSAEYYSGFTVEELTGDVFDDDLFNRQIAVQDKYNIVIEENDSGSVNGIK